MCHLFFNTLICVPASQLASQKENEGMQVEPTLKTRLIKDDLLTDARIQLITQ